MHQTPSSSDQTPSSSDQTPSSLSSKRSPLSKRKRSNTQRAQAPRTQEQQLRQSDERIRHLQFGTFENEVEYLKALKVAKMQKKSLLEEMLASKKNLTFKKSEDTDQLVNRWREACQEILQDFHSRALELGMNTQSIGGSSGGLYQSEAKKRRISANHQETEEGDQSQNENDNTELTLTRLLQLLGVNPDLAHFDEENDAFVA